MKIYNPEKSGMTSSKKVQTANTTIAVFLFVLSLFILLHTQSLNAEGSGMINRAPLEKVAPAPTELEKISNDLDGIIKSINEISEEEESTILIAKPPEEESTILIAKPKKPAAEKPAPVIAKPEKVTPKKTELAKTKPKIFSFSPLQSA